ncbi:antifungal protein ginkbilobin-2-like [Dorcoceras hygrometricum]|uniref:Antifungal protein ginkbilobin-2-like n=1 Tax=Dorcoceras hygrometricum TaxID=472368 RepID=A0A2Z7BDH8_9LAMI|nr:antifungal protein ginkbilobin-2-like [Dorcoceras hygrometricum]
MGLLATTFFCVGSEPDTTVTTLICNGNTYLQDDPFGDSVAYVLADLMNVTPSQQGFNYYTVSPYPTAVAYGHATCSQSLANSECANCLATARGTLSTTCGGHIGGQVGMVDCGMRFEDYSFS